MLGKGGLSSNTKSPGAPAGVLAGGRQSTGEVRPENRLGKRAGWAKGPPRRLRAQHLAAVGTQPLPGPAGAGGVGSGRRRAPGPGRGPAEAPALGAQTPARYRSG